MLDNLPFFPGRLPEAQRTFSISLARLHPVSACGTLTVRAGTSRFTPRRVGALGKRWLARCFGEAGQVGSAPAAFRRRISLVPLPGRARARRDGEHRLLVRHGHRHRRPQRGEDKLRRSEQELSSLIRRHSPSYRGAGILRERPSPRINRRSDYTGSHDGGRAAPSFRELVFHRRTSRGCAASRQEAFARGLPFANEQRARRKGRPVPWFSSSTTPFGMEMDGACIGTRPVTDIDDRKPPNKSMQMRTGLRIDRSLLDCSRRFVELVPASLGACSLRWQGGRR